MIELIPISVTKVDWTTYQKAIQGILNRSITKKIDELKIKPEGIKAYLATLTEFKSRGSKPEFDGCLLQHISISFLAITPPELMVDVSFTTDLKILTCEDERLTLISGTLEQWRNSIINGCCRHVPKDVRIFFNKVADRFCQLDLRQVFEEYTRKSHADGTFLLEFTC